MSLLPLLYVGIGGFLGATVRYLLSTWVHQHLADLPLGTAVVNVTGSFLLALVLAWTQRDINPLPDHVKLLIGTDFLGSYTTFSTFANESIRLLQADWRAGVGYVVATNGLCLLGVVLGLWVAAYLWSS